MTLQLDTAMLMAAGLGKRMLPLTVNLPKPLVPVAGQPLMDHALDRIEEAGIRRTVVNVHYLADAVETHLGARARRTGADYVVSDERECLLETGGGLIKALPLLGDRPFLCANSDNIWINGPVDSIRALAARWDDESMDALLLLVPLANAACHSGTGDFRMDAAGRLSRREAEDVSPFVFTGVQILSPRLIIDPPGDIFSTNIFWNRAIVQGRAFGMVHEGPWFDVGTPGAIPLVEAAVFPHG